MFKYLVRSAIALGLAAALAPAGAQTARKTSLEFTPYAGYMVYGKYLEGPLGTSLTNASSPLYGAQIGLNLGQHVSVVGNVAYAKSDVEVGVPFLGGISVGSSNVLLYDGSLQLRLPLPASTVSPFVQAGAGMIRYDIENRFLNTKANNVAFNVGGGFDYQITPNIGLRLMAKDYVGKFDFKDATQFDIKGKTAHNFALSAGIKLGF